MSCRLLLLCPRCPHHRQTTRGPNSPGTAPRAALTGGISTPKVPAANKTTCLPACLPAPLNAPLTRPPTHSPIHPPHLPPAEDHKPAAPDERARIMAAGGFLSEIGGITRVNGNLNLSRAIGDLRYKMNAEVGVWVGG